MLVGGDDNTATRGLMKRGRPFGKVKGPPPRGTATELRMRWIRCVVPVGMQVDRRRRSIRWLLQVMNGDKDRSWFIEVVKSKLINPLRRGTPAAMEHMERGSWWTE